MSAITKPPCELLSNGGISHSLGLAIPLQSLLGVAGNSAHVFVVDPKTGTVLRRSVTFEALDQDTRVKVTQGLSSSDIVVAQGSAFIRQGEQVTYDHIQTQGAQ